MVDADKQIYKFVTTIDQFRPEARDPMIRELQQIYGYGKFWTWPDGIESEMEMEVHDPKETRWIAESLVDHIRSLNAYPDPERRVYCKVTIQVIKPGMEQPWDEFRY